LCLLQLRPAVAPERKADADAGGGEHRPADHRGHDRGGGDLLPAADSHVFDAAVGPQQGFAWCEDSGYLVQELSTERLYLSPHQAPAQIHGRGLAAPMVKTLSVASSCDSIHPADLPLSPAASPTAGGIKA